MTKSEAGRIGGQVTVALYGRDHMTRIARKGARAFWRKYTIKPVGVSDFALILRATGEPTGTTLRGEKFL